MLGRKREPTVLELWPPHPCPPVRLPDLAFVVAVVDEAVAVQVSKLPANRLVHVFERRLHAPATGDPLTSDVIGQRGVPDIQRYTLSAEIPWNSFHKLHVHTEGRTGNHRVALGFYTFARSDFLFCRVGWQRDNQQAR